jgi:hypothetical protein
LAERTPRIEVAGLVFRVAGLAAAGRAWVEGRYGPFLSRRAPTFGVHVRGGERYRRGRTPRPSVMWNDCRFALASYPSRAEGDLGRRRVAFRAGPGPALNPDLFRLLCSFLLMQKCAVLLHASAVVDRDRAWVFSGPSGSGKTTIAGLAGDRHVLNDETIALRHSARRWEACATPFYGSGGPAMARVNDRAPIRGLCFLRKGDHFAHRCLTPAQVVSRAFPEVMLPKREARVAERLLATLASLAAAVPAWELTFAPDPTIWSYLDGLD